MPQSSPHAALDRSDDPSSVAQKKRNFQHVLNHQQRGVIVSWAAETIARSSDDKICGRTVSNFPQFFRRNAKANLQRASRYWKNRKKFLSKYRTRRRDQGLTVTRCTPGGLQTFISKSGPGFRRKMAPWVTLLYKELAEDFDRFRNAGVLFTAKLLRTLALRIIQKGNDVLIGPNVTDMTSGQPLATHITSSWIQNFMQKNDIVCRSQCETLQVSPAKRELIAREVAYHLGELCRGFRKGTIKEDDVMNADEMHFVINLHNHKTRARKGHSDVKYADVVNGDEGMAMLVLLTGEPNYMILPPLMIFKMNHHLTRFAESRTTSKMFLTDLIRKPGWMEESFKDSSLSHSPNW